MNAEQVIALHEQDTKDFALMACNRYREQASQAETDKDRYYFTWRAEQAKAVYEAHCALYWAGCAERDREAGTALAEFEARDDDVTSRLHEDRSIIHYDRSEYYRELWRGEDA